MISSIFFDLDETLVHTFFTKPKRDDYFEHYYNGEPYFTVVNDYAWRMLLHARHLVGNDKVFILTAAFRDYTDAICKYFGLGFQNDQIFTRDDLRRFNIHGQAPVHAHRQNVLVDDLNSSAVQGKLAFIGARDDRHIQIPAYYGLLQPDAKIYFETFVDQLNLMQSEL
jgi:hypothetical protein